MKSHLHLLILFLFLSLGINAQITSIGLIGSATAGGWDAETPMTRVDDSTWTLSITLTDGAAKFRADNSWTVNWGALDFPSGVGTQDGSDIPVFAGDYLVTFNSNSGAYYFDVDSDIGIIGSATAGGWDNDTDMYINQLDTNKYYGIYNLSEGAAKFRANDSWDINWGSTDFPSGIGTQAGSDIPVSPGGKYRVDFDKSTGAYSFSEVIDFTSIGVIGSATAGGWDNETPLVKSSTNPDEWKGTVILVEGELKFRADSSWTQNWGGTDFPSGVGELNSSNNIPVPAGAEGEYQVTFNTKTFAYSFLIIGDYETIGIVGSATPGGWDTDTDLVQDPNDKSVWKLRIELVDGEAKFRANDAWDISWGGETFPSGIATTDFAPNFLIPAGDYKITFNSTTGEYNFEAVVEFDRVSLVGKSGPFNDWPGDDESRDSFMEKDAEDGNLWTLDNIALRNYEDDADGGVKFRADASWTINWGAEDFPNGVGTLNGPNIRPVAGNYNVVFRADTGEYAFSPASSTNDRLDPALVKLFPNPAVNDLTIELPESYFKGNSDIQLISSNGQLVKKVLTNSTTVKLNVSDLMNGNYRLQIKNGNTLVSKSVVIVR